MAVFEQLYIWVVMADENLRLLGNSLFLIII
jgi:hypothetical protein